MSTRPSPLTADSKFPAVSSTVAMIFSSQDGHRLDTPTGIDNPPPANIPAKAGRCRTARGDSRHRDSPMLTAARRPPEQIIQAVRDLDMDHGRARREADKASR
jgi:hypothetical protein